MNPVLKKQYGVDSMPETGENVAADYNVSREDQDEFAFNSHQKAIKAIEGKKFSDGIVPITVKETYLDENEKQKEREYVVDTDEGPRANTSIKALAKLRPVFADKGSVTAGNSSQLSDGASVTMVMSEDKANELGVKPLAYFRGFTVVGCQPDEMGIGPVYSIPKLLKSANLTVDDIDLWELNEAFASQVVYIKDQLGLPTENLNVNGGSIAIGHPFGMTGSRQVGHLTRELRRRGGKYGIVTMCVGGGMGATGLFESIPE